jgi:hypothetical protein
MFLKHPQYSFDARDVVNLTLREQLFKWGNEMCCFPFLRIASCNDANCTSSIRLSLSAHLNCIWFLCFQIRCQTQAKAIRRLQAMYSTKHVKTLTSFLGSSWAHELQKLRLSEMRVWILLFHTSKPSHLVMYVRWL